MDRYIQLKLTFTKYTIHTITLSINQYHIMRKFPLGLRRGELADLGEMLSRIITYTDDDTL